MNDETRMQVDLDEPSSERGDEAMPQHLEAVLSSQEMQQQTIAIAATFTADPLRGPMRFWMDMLEIPAAIELAPYAQVMQELLDPSSLLSGNARGFNVLLIRIDDWIRDRLQQDIDENIEHWLGVARDFGAAVRKLRARGSSGILIYFCPPSPLLPAVYQPHLEAIQRELIAQLSTLPHTHCWSHGDVVRLYPSVAHLDDRADRIAHIPYTQEYFVAIATFLARRIAVQVKPQYKVIAVDCDNTLWKGICGEDGAAGVELTPAHLEFQRLLVRQHDAGVLLCLCSKNNTDDVDAVFRMRPEMPLREEHVMCSRVNWNSKSSNLRSLAEELDLALDSFVFIDDSAIECAEVRAHCPAVLALQLPQSEQEISHFLDHIWAFDRLGITPEATQRTQQYRQNRARSKAQEEATDLNQFLASLDLKVDIAAMQPAQLGRVAELIQRTNQFNLTSIRRRSAELESLIDLGELRCLVTQVRDRFGDYGLVGAVLFKRTTAGLEIDTFVLSCRVLGRGVEHRIVNELGRIARREGLTDVVLRVRHTARNEPARRFLEKSFADLRDVSAEGSGVAGEDRFVVPVELAERVECVSVGEASAKPKQAVSLAGKAKVPTKWHDAAYKLSRLADIAGAIDRSMPRAQVRRAPFAPPQTPIEMTIAGIWADVLRCGDVGRQDNFFDLGGDSLLAVQVIVRVGSALDLELPIHQFFEQPTVQHLAELLISAPRSRPAIQVADRNRPIPLSWSQQRLWFIEKLEGSTTAYHIPLCIKLAGELQEAALLSALETIVDRHEALRSVVDMVDGEPVQRIIPEASFAVIRQDLSQSPDPQADLMKQSQEELARPFDLSTGPLIRGRLLRLQQDEHVLLITMHHMVSDGWSVGVFIRELAEIYEAHRQGNSTALPSLPIQYADYALWQRQWLSEACLQDQLQYWTEHLRGAPERLELPTDRLRPKTLSYRGADVELSVPAEITAKLKKLARESNVTLAMTLYAAWFVLLSRLSGQQDIVVGMPVANRPRAELEALIGYFVNTLALRMQLADDPTLEATLQRVKQSMLGAYANQDLPFDRVVDALQPTRSLSHSPIFQILFVFQNTPRSQLQLSALTMTEQDVPSHTAQFDLSLSLRETADGLAGTINFATDLFDAATIEGWSRCFEVLLRSMVSHPALPINRLPLMQGGQQLRLLESFNSTRDEYPQHQLVHELFEKQVQRVPDGLAIECAGQSLSYAQLNERANQLAHHLIAAGVRPNDPVGLCVQRSLELVVGWLGVLKAGAAYLPLDPTYPAERLAYMIGDAKPRLLLTQDALRERLSGMASVVVALDSDWDAIACSSVDNPQVDETAALRSHHLAYVIYTSGSTGRPKGAMIEHRNVLNLWQGLERLYDRSGPCQRVALNASFNFDASVQQFVQLLSGRSVFVIPEELRRDPAALLSFFEQQRIDAVDCTPSQLRSWIAAGLLDPTRLALRLILVGGEPIDPDLWSTLARGATHVYNVYGPTECTVDATVACLHQDISAPHIGRPMLNRRIYVLDGHAQPVPAAVAGEIYIGGEGVGRGYLDRAELTAEHFIPDPFSLRPGERMYKTGDLGRWRANGFIDYLGRNDQQVKIRGFRIELGEIEAQLLHHELVREAVVIAQQSATGEKLLIAYVVPSVPDSADADAILRIHLLKVLPDYMVPTAFVMLPKMPLTPSGKLDRRALPEPGRDAFAIQQYEAPQGELEQTLVGIWQSLLRIPKVGRDDSFFRLGGSSLTAMQLQARIQAAISIEVPVRVIFESPTIRELAARLEELRRRRLLDKVVRSGVDVKVLLKRVASMRPNEVQDLLRELTMEGRL